MGFIVAQPKGWDKSRAAQHEDATGQTPTMPPLEAGEYVVEAFKALGMAEDTLNGLAVLSWAEISGFMQATGAISEDWESVLLRDMSKAYIRGIKLGKNELGRPPWSGSVLRNSVRIG